MNSKTGIWIVIATSLLVVGCIAFGGVMTMLKWDFNKIATVKLETNTHIISENFKEISLNTNTADIQFLPSEDGQCKVICYEEEKLKHSVSVHNNTLSIRICDERKWYDHIGIQFQTPKITVYLPAGEYGDLTIKASTGDLEIAKEFRFNSISVTESTGNVICYASAADAVSIKTSTGDIAVENITAENIDLSVTTGKINVQCVNCEKEFKVNVNTGKTQISDTKCGKFTSTGSTGDITLNKVITLEKLSIERDTGDITFDQFDASELFIKTSTGDIKGTLLSDKIFVVDCNTGKVVVPKTTSGGKCELTSDTGDIIIKIND